MRLQSSREQFVLTPLTQVRMFLDCSNYASCSCSNLLCFITWIISIQQRQIFGIIQMWRCALNWFTLEPVHRPKLDICHLCGFKGNIYQTCFFLLIPSYVQIIPNWHEFLHDTSNATYPKYLLLDFWIGQVWTGVNPRGRCTVVALLLQIESFPEKSQKPRFVSCFE
jgi:hypothetical protein